MIIFGVNIRSVKMVNKFWWLVLVLFVICSYGVCADKEFIDIVTVDRTHDNAMYDRGMGWNIFFNESGKLINITKGHLDDGRDFRIWDSSYNLVAENLGVDSGSTWFMNTNLEVGNYFFMVANRPGGAAATLHYKQVFQPTNFKYGRINGSPNNESGVWFPGLEWQTLESFYFEPSEISDPPNVTVLKVVSPGGVTYNPPFGVLEFEFGDWMAYGSATDPDLQELNISVHNFSDLIVMNSTNLSNISVIFSSDVIRDFLGNPFNVSVIAWDNDSSNSTAELFNVTDTVSPVCVGFDNVSVTNNSVYTWAVSCSDESFFSLNVSCPQYSNYTEGLNVENWGFSDSFVVNITNDCIIKYCDGHTSRILSEDFRVVFRNSSLEVSNKGRFNRFSAYTDRDSVRVSSVRGVDRVSFVFDYRDSREIFDPERYEGDHSLKHRTFFYEASPGSYYFDDDKYKGWIVDGRSKVWFDANVRNDAGAVVDVQRFNFTHWKIVVSSTENILEFESIGQLNCVDAIQQIKVVSPGPGVDIEGIKEFETIPQAMFHIFMVFLWIVFVIMALSLRGPNGKTIQFFNILQMLVAFVEGTAFIKFSVLIGFPIIFVGLGIFIGLIMDKK